ncbi:MAG: primosomal protein N', partial [Candidatus Baltobacteraceae bacterium]
MPLVRTVDALATIRSSRFDLPLSYDAGDWNLQVGDIVRVPLGTREVLAFVITDPVERVHETPLRKVIERSAAPRAFTPVGLALAKFVADRYICTLGEALGAIVLSGAIPRMIDSFVRTVPHPSPQRYPSVPVRFVSLVWDELADGFGLEQLLRHPEARRIGDRATLLRHIGAIVRSAEIKRVRRFVDPRTQEYRIAVLFRGAAQIKGPKANALIAFVREQPGVPRADALLAGFSPALIARVLKAGALREESISPARSRRHRVLSEPQFEATAEQQASIDRVIERLESNAFYEMLLHGITGSGKTFVYIEAIKRVVRDGGKAIVLVPEISLTPQTARRFELVFGERIAILHSALSERERYDAWQACMSGDVDVVVGARSAVFAPLPDVRLLVIDEAHETTYKQDTAPRYHAVAVARERMKRESGVLLLGSATPSLESYAAARAGSIERLQLPLRATRASLPAVHLVDMAKEFEAGNRRIFSSRLTHAIDARLQADEKTVLFVNRRGSAGFMLCRRCGYVPECDRCSVSLTVHRSEGLLRCHYCDAQRPIPPACPACRGGPIKDFGVGTERVAADVVRLYPNARVIRMDSDTTTRIGDHARLLDAFEHDGDVLVGTQMVAKGLDFPTVTLVGVVAADIGLHTPDFRAGERT